jgi:glycosyltransferase involved in cell wall biosynthesis
MFDRVRRRLRRLKNETRSTLWSLRWRGKRKPLSALVRVRDGGEFLMPSVESIISLVEEVVVVDNYSRDNTPKVIQEMAARYPGKLRACRYDHDVATVGEDSARLYHQDPTSPCLLHNYYNWCMALCRHPFVLKWDDDMLASDKLVEAIEDFKQSRYLQFEFGGHNISSDFKHVLTWKAGIEARVYPSNTKFLMGDYGGVVKSGFTGQYMGETPAMWVASKYTLRLEHPLYAHLKYCKRNPGSNQSQAFRKALESEIKTGESISEEFKLLLQKYLGHAST